MNNKRQPRQWIRIGLLLLLALSLVGCFKKEAPAKAAAPPPAAEAEEVFKEMPEDEAKVLTNRVREYAEAFDIGTVDKDLKALIRAAVPKGTAVADSTVLAREAILPFMEEQLKLKIAEGLDELVGRHTEEDVELIFEEMNTESLIDFVVHYEMERLKMEGYLR